MGRLDYGYYGEVRDVKSRDDVIKGIECNLNFVQRSDCECCGYKCDKEMVLSVPINLLADALALLKAQEPITGETSDGYHTFNELYHHRAVLFSVIVANYPERAWKSKKHHDGTMYDGMFIVGIDTPTGQATYHYDVDPYWDMFACKVLESAPEWDGHTPAQAIERIGKLKAQEPRVVKMSELTAGEPMLVWLEDIDKEETVAGMIFDYVPGRLGFKLTDLASRDRIYPLIDEYLTRWRCWTSRPDKATREATPWD